MKTYLISRGWYAVETTEVTAESEDEAIELAKEIPDEHWEDVGGNDDVLYQSEGEV